MSEGELQRLFRLKKRKRGLDAKPNTALMKLKREQKLSTVSKIVSPAPQRSSDISPEPKLGSMAPPSSLRIKGAPTAQRQVHAAPAAPVDQTHRRKLTEFYQQFNPSKIADVDKLLIKYRGKESKLFKSLLKKYPQAAKVLSLTTPGVLPAPETLKAQALASETAARVSAARAAAANQQLTKERGVTSTSKTSRLIQEAENSSNSALPKGFFDDRTQDLLARQVDPQLAKKALQEEEWDKFKAFAEVVKTSSIDPQEEAARLQKERDARAEFEQQQYKSRIARLAAMRDRMRQKAKPTEHQASANDDRNDHVEPADVDVDSELDSEAAENVANLDDVLSIMQVARNARTKKLKALREKEFTPLNPLDWRSKSTE